MSVGPEALQQLQQIIWHGSISLHITLAPAECRTYDASHPYLVHHPRVSYLPSLLPQLRSFFAHDLIDPRVAAHEGWFSCEGVPLKWQYPLGLLFDAFSGAEPTSMDSTGQKYQHDDKEDRDVESKDITPWKLELHFIEWPKDLLIPLDADWKVNHDVFMNTVKEADFLRNGSARAIMSLSKDDSTKLWTSIQNHDFKLFNSINQKFLNLPGGQALRHVPLKVYLPHAETEADQQQSRGSLRVVQGLVTPNIATRDTQTLGTALHGFLPTVFPSRRSYIHAHAVLHGAIVPLSTPVMELMRYASYSDGFLHVAVVMLG